MLNWILKLKIIFLYKWYSEINHTTKKKSLLNIHCNQSKLEKNHSFLFLPDV